MFVTNIESVYAEVPQEKLTPTASCMPVFCTLLDSVNILLNTFETGFAYGSKNKNITYLFSKNSNNKSLPSQQIKKNYK